MSKKLIYSLSFILVLSMAGSAWSGASKRIPADGAVIKDTWARLGWTGGPNAALFV